MKRLIVLCDGTWFDSTNASAREFPSNVTRFSRALSPYAVEKGEKIPQIAFYQPGVGTSPGVKLRGGIYGAGLSANIRAAYGFLCHNWEKGDEIFFFGYSRGAYTVRSIAGLISSLGLLTKRGMDQFPRVYNQYYNHRPGQDSPEFDEVFRNELMKKGDLRLVGDAIKIIGVWDTVGFHWTNGTGEKIEFYNQKLPEDVKHAYHALALDEDLGPFTPTLWEIPNGGTQDLQQVWFSGTHGGVGGGNQDSRLPDISLGWMIAQCSEGEKLAFMDGNGKDDPPDRDQYYLLDRSIRQADAVREEWRTVDGPSEPQGGLIQRGAQFLRSWIPFLRPANRTPKSLATVDVATNESIHCSIKHRDLKRWPSAPLQGTHSGNKWYLTNKPNNDTLQETEPSPVEMRYKGRIKNVS
ncbi:hypothetical protein BBP40_005843 [Aspergillus hancockii]|nr:hypothetical protein BBP40_005843 [Aspergillus hancockii]